MPNYCKISKNIDDSRSRLPIVEKSIFFRYYLNSMPIEPIERKQIQVKKEMRQIADIFKRQPRAARFTVLKSNEHAAKLRGDGNRFRGIVQNMLQKTAPELHGFLNRYHDVPFDQKQRMESGRQIIMTFQYIVNGQFKLLTPPAEKKKTSSKG